MFCEVIFKRICTVYCLKVDFKALPRSYCAVYAVLIVLEVRFVRIYANKLMAGRDFGTDISQHKPSQLQPLGETGQNAYILDAINSKKSGRIYKRARPSARSR